MTQTATAHLGLPLPATDGTLEVDVVRIRTAFNLLDAKIADLDTLLFSDDLDLDSVQELVAALKSAQGTLGAILGQVDERLGDFGEAAESSLATVYSRMESLEVLLNEKAPSDNPTLTGAIVESGSVSGKITEPAALEIDCSLSNYFIKSISAAASFTFANAPATGAYAFTLKLIHAAGVVTWPISVIWPGSTAPTLDAGKTHLFTFVTDDAGTSWHGVACTNYTT